MNSVVSAPTLAYFVWGHWFSNAKDADV